MTRNDDSCIIGANLRIFIFVQEGITQFTSTGIIIWTRVRLLSARLKMMLLTGETIFLGSTVYIYDMPSLRSPAAESWMRRQQKAGSAMRATNQDGFSRGGAFTMTDVRTYTRSTSAKSSRSVVSRR